MKASTILLLLATTVIILGITFTSLQFYKPPVEQAVITNFNECSRAGYQITLTYPATCKSPSGKVFVENIAPINPSPNPSPTPNPESGSLGYVMGHITIGPNCPGPEMAGRPCPPSEQAYSSRSVIVYGSDKTTVKQTGKIDESGNYKITLAPGSYFVQINPAGIGPGEKKPLTIRSLQTSVLDFDIDTGIR